MVFLLLAAAGCYKDLSTEATMTLPDLVILGLEPQLDVVYGQEISVSVQAYMGEKKGSDFEYLWEVDVNAGRTDNRAEIGTEPSLNYKVANTPSSTPYALTVRVTDPETGLSGMRTCFLHVSTSLGEGLLVAYTLGDGETSEIDIVATPAITYGYEGDPRITRGLYGLSNDGNPFPERITCLLQTCDTQNGVYDSHRILVGSTNHVTALNPLTLKAQEQDSQLFSSTTITEFGPSVMFNCAGYTSYIIIGDSGYAHICSIDNVYAKIAKPAGIPVSFSPYNVGYAATDQGRFILFDNGFYEILAYKLLGGGLQKMDITGMLDFSVEGARSLMGGCLRGMRPAFLIQDRNGLYHIVITELGKQSDSFFSVPFEGAEIEDAVSIAFCDNGDLFYYATDRSIYAAVISGNTSQTHKLTWTPASPDERITDIKQYTQAWYGTQQLSASDYSYILPTHRSMLIITTYNDKTGEGKFYLRGFNVSTGTFTFSGDYGSYGGFGEITAITPTLR